MCLSPRCMPRWMRVSLFSIRQKAMAKSERVLGQGLKGRRQDAVIATKVGGSHLSSDDLPRACEQSLKSLQTDYIDLYQIHWPNHNIPIAETASALQRLRDQGKIRAIGVCNFACGDLSDLLAVANIVTNQLSFSLLWRVIEREIQPMCLENNIGIICYSPLDAGVAYRTLCFCGGCARWSGANPACFRMIAPWPDTVKKAVRSKCLTRWEKVRAVADEAGVAMAEIALAWALQQPGITSLLVGARNPDEVQWNLPAVDLALPEDILQTLI